MPAKKSPKSMESVELKDVVRPMRRILVGTDLSPSADTALDLASLVAVGYSCKIDMVHVDVPANAMIMPRHSNQVLVQKKMPARISRGAIDTSLVQRKKILEAKGIGCDCFRVSADAADIAGEIVYFSELGHYDLVVVGNSGPRETRGSFHGSVSWKVAMESSCPVLLARTGINAIRRILVAYDCSPGSKNTLNFVVDLAARLNAAVNLISVFSFDLSPLELFDSRALARLEETKRGQLEEAESFLKIHKIASEGGKLIGSSEIPRIITEEAEIGVYDFLAIGSRHSTENENNLLGVNASEVARLTSPRLNLLIVK